MSIVAVHGPNTFGSKAVTEVGPAVATVSPTNGLIWTFKLDQPSTRTASLVWTYPTGTPATSTGPGPTTVTFASVGSKAVTAVATGVGEGANPYPPAGTTNIPVTAYAGTGAPGTSPLSVEGRSGEEVYDPGEHTVGEVQEHANTLDSDEEIRALYDAELAGKSRSTLVSYLESLLPYDPSEHTVDEVVAYVTDNPSELDDIVAAEKAGKDRKTLLSHLEALQTT